MKFLVKYSSFVVFLPQNSSRLHNILDYFKSTYLNLCSFLPKDNKSIKYDKEPVISKILKEILSCNKFKIQLNNAVVCTV